MTEAAYEKAQAAQASAADPISSVFVTANAGSGKTKVLIDRIARLLLLGSPPSSFLCITYTKAAAAEMQRRLFARLGGWCVAEDAALAKELAALTGQDQANPEDFARARALFAQALETPGGLKIQTIHAFCERLLARFPLEAGAPPGFEIADEALSRMLIADSWDRLSRDDRAAAALKRFSGKLDQARLEGLMARLVGQRGALATFFPPGADPAQCARAIRRRFGPLQDPDEILQELVAKAPWVDLQAAAAALSGGSSTDQETAGLIAKASQTRIPDDYLAIFLTQKRELKKKPVTKPMLEQHAFLARLFSGAGEMGRVEHALAQSRAAARGLDTEGALILSGLLNAAYRDGKTRRAALDFDDLIETATALLQDEAAGPWVLYKLDGGIDHMLIDEGQDTSPAQWALLEPLRSEFFAGEGARALRRTVFAVGDPKQSIYSFQGADPGRFLAEAQALDLAATAVGAPFTAPEMTMSFRSTPEVLAAVDATFKALDMAGDPPTQFDTIAHVANRREARGCVEWWPIAPRPERVPTRAWDAPLDQEPDDSASARLAGAVADAAAAMIANREAVGGEDGEDRPVTAGDILVLVRSRGKLFNQLLQACKRKGLPVAGADRLRLTEDIAVQDALGLMRIAIDPYDDLSLACVLKGPWLGLTDDAAHLYPLAAHRGVGESLYSRLMASTDDLYVEAKSFMERLRERRDLPAFEFLASALEERGPDGRSGWRRVFERLGPECADPLQELLNKALAAGSRGESGLQAFVWSIEQDEALIKRELEGPGGALRIMTVHGAKGLEAPVVILPDTTKSPDLGADSGLFLDGSDCALALTGKGEDDPVTAELRARHEGRALGEHWRLLYVAMTRARDRLIVCGHGRGQGRGTAEAQCWHVQVRLGLERLGAEKLETRFGPGLRLGAPAIAIERATRTSASPVMLPAWATASAASPAQPSEALRPSRAGALSPRTETARLRRGTLIHGLLQRLPEVTPDRRKAAGLAWLQRQGVSPGLQEAYLDEAIAVIDDARFSAVFGANSRAEAPIVGTIRGRAVRGVIDRLVVTGDVVLALDFKTDRPPPLTAEEAPEAYVLQMALYREALRQALPGRMVDCAFVWTYAPVLTPLTVEQMDRSLRQAGLD